MYKLEEGYILEAKLGFSRTAGRVIRFFNIFEDVSEFYYKIGHFKRVLDKLSRYEDTFNRVYSDSGLDVSESPLGETELIFHNFTTELFFETAEELLKEESIAKKPMEFTQRLLVRMAEVKDSSSAPVSDGTISINTSLFAKRYIRSGEYAGVKMNEDFAKLVCLYADKYGVEEPGTPFVEGELYIQILPSGCWGSGRPLMIGEGAKEDVLDWNCLYTNFIPRWVWSAANTDFEETVEHYHLYCRELGEAVFRTELGRMQLGRASLLAKEHNLDIQILSENEVPHFRTSW